MLLRTAPLALLSLLAACEQAPTTLSDATNAPLATFASYCEAYQAGSLAPQTAETVRQMLFRIGQRPSSPSAADCAAAADVFAGAEQLSIRYQGTPGLGIPGPEAPITDLAPVATLTHLKQLFLTGNELTSLAALASMTNLEVLGLMAADITDDVLATLPSLPRLRELYIGNPHNANGLPAGMWAMIHPNLNKIRSLAALPALPELELLAVDGVGLESAEGLTRFPYLRALDINRNKVSNLAPLASIVTMERLYARENGIADLAPLAGMTALRIFDAPLNRIVDLAPLARLTALRTLGLGGNAIVDVAPLAGLINLEKLFLAHNPDLADVSSLVEADGLTTSLERLQELWLNGTRVTQCPEALEAMCRF